MAAETATYAIVKTGGKQYKVAVGDILKVEKIETEPGASVSLPVALVVAGAKVTTDAGTWLAWGTWNGTVAVGESITLTATLVSGREPHFVFMKRPRVPAQPKVRKRATAKAVS